MTSVPYTVEVLDKLRWNAHLGKHKHFEAARVGRRNHVSFGVPVVLINVLLASVLFAFIGEDGVFPQWGKWAGASLTLLAAVLSAVQTFFNFEKEYMEHRAVANEYLGIARECERLLALHFDNLLPLTDLSSHIERINGEYGKINTRSEGLNISRDHYKEALKVQEKKRSTEQSLLERYKSETTKRTP